MKFYRSELPSSEPFCMLKAVGEGHVESNEDFWPEFEGVLAKFEAPLQHKEESRIRVGTLFEMGIKKALHSLRPQVKIECGIKITEPGRASRELDMLVQDGDQTLHLEVAYFLTTSWPLVEEKAEKMRKDQLSWLRGSKQWQEHLGVKRLTSLGWIAGAYFGEELSVDLEQFDWLEVSRGPEWFWSADSFEKKVFGKFPRVIGESLVIRKSKQTGELSRLIVQCGA